MVQDKIMSLLSHQYSASKGRQTSGGYVFSHSKHFHEMSGHDIKLCVLAMLFMGPVSLPLLSSVLCLRCIFYTVRENVPIIHLGNASHSWPQPNVSASPFPVSSKVGRGETNCLSAWCWRGWACAQLQLCQ